MAGRRAWLPAVFVSLMLFASGLSASAPLSSPPLRSAAAKPSHALQDVYEDNRQYCNHWIPAIEHPQIAWTAKPPAGGWSDLNERYSLIRQVGLGAFSTVHLAESKSTGEKVVVKILDKSFYSKYSRRMEVEHELVILASLPKNEPAINKFIEFFQDENHIYQILGYVEGKPLSALVSKNGEDVARSWMKKVTAALKKMHAADFYHMDFNSANVIITPEEQLTIIDFGRTTQGDIPRIYNAGAYGYHTPERLLNIPAYPSKWDVWYIGVLTYQLVYGEFPFGGQLNEEYTKRALNRDLKWPETPSDELEDLLFKIFVRQNQRLTLDEVISHPWFNK